MFLLSKFLLQDFIQDWMPEERPVWIRGVSWKLRIKELNYLLKILIRFGYFRLFPKPSCLLRLRAVSVLDLKCLHDQQLVQLAQQWVHCSHLQHSQKSKELFSHWSQLFLLSFIKQLCRLLVLQWVKLQSYELILHLLKSKMPTKRHQFYSSSAPSRPPHWLHPMQRSRLQLQLSDRFGFSDLH